MLLCDHCIVIYHPHRGRVERNFFAICFRITYFKKRTQVIQCLSLYFSNYIESKDKTGYLFIRHLLNVLYTSKHVLIRHLKHKYTIIIMVDKTVHDLWNSYKSNRIFFLVHNSFCRSHLLFSNLYNLYAALAVQQESMHVQFKLPALPYNHPLILGWVAVKQNLNVWTQSFPKIFVPHGYKVFCLQEGFKFSRLVTVIINVDQKSNGLITQARRLYDVVV